MKEVYIKPGEMFFSADEPTLIQTVLGSCISVCVYDKKNKCGGMNHFVYPDSDEGETSHRYARPAILDLLKKFKYEVKSKKEDLVIKILGGANKSTMDKVAVGRENIKAAHEWIDRFGFEIDKDEVGGTRGRKVRFNTETGEVLYKYLDKTENLKDLIVDFPEEAGQQKTFGKVGVMIIDDSKPVREVLKKIIGSHPMIDVVAEAGDPFEAVKVRKTCKPDVITLDINMPKMDGVTYLKQYMLSEPVPTIMITDYDDKSSTIILDSLEAGAIDYMKKPSIKEFELIKDDICNKILAANSSKNFKKETVASVDAFSSTANFGPGVESQNIIYIGASTGGTEALREVLMKLPANIPPILIVQHIPPIFSYAFAERLNSLCPFRVTEAVDGEMVESKTVYIAPGGRHMKVKLVGERLRIQLTDDPPVNRFRPSVDYLFNSVQKIPGRNMVGIILTGMGDDGAQGLLHLKNLGAYTIGQNSDSCVVYGMPKVANEIGAVQRECSLRSIPSVLAGHFNR